MSSPFYILFLVQKWFDAEIQEESVLQELVARCEADPHFAKVSQELRADHDAIQGKTRAEIKADPALEARYSRAQAFRLVATGGPDEASYVTFYEKPKSAARKEVDATPSWIKYIGQRSLNAIWPLFQAEVTRLVTTDRAETEKNSTGLPPAVVDAHSFFDLCEAFQKNYMVGSEEVPTDVWTYGEKGEKKTRMSLGWRLDKYRPEPKKKETAPAAAPAEPTPAPAPPAE